MEEHIVQTNLKDIAHSCAIAAYEGSMSFPQIVAKLSETGFEGYWVDYRTHQQTFYHSTQQSFIVKVAAFEIAIAATFDAPKIAQLIRWAQQGTADYNYIAFCEQIIKAGCAGYLVSLTGKRVVYLGTTGDVHIEFFPA
mgnify:CR=1 FL=1